jgi:hypothetical protein
METLSSDVRLYNKQHGMNVFKFFTPGLLRILREHGRLGEDVLPFWTVFQGDITRDPCRVREVALWFDKYAAHFFMWRNQKDPMPLLKHFDAYLKRLLL